MHAILSIINFYLDLRFMTKFIILYVQRTPLDIYGKHISTYLQLHQTL